MKRFLVSFLAVLTLAACTSRRADEGKVLNLVLSDDVKTLDPASAYDSVSLTVMPLVLESLYQYRYTKLPLELEPLLAEGMPAISKDLKTFTITIQKGVKWQDDAAFPGGKGRELKAQDFIYAWKRMLLPQIQSPGTWMFDGKVVGWDDYRKRLIENRADAEKILEEPVPGLLATDDYTLQIKLLQPYPQLVNVLAMGFGAPVAKELTAKYGQEGLNNRLVGTGPFRLVELIKGSKIILEKSKSFRGEAYPSDGDEDAKSSGLLQSAGLKLPFVDKITFLIIKEDQPAWLQFRKGNLDAAGVPKDSFSSAIDAGDLRPELKAQGVKLRKAEEAVSWYLNFNMKDKLVGTNANLRKAISMAINRDEFIEKFLNGRGVKATSIVPRVIAGFSGRTEVVNDFNPKMAKEYLVKAGYPEGNGLPVIKYDLRGPSTSANQQAEYFQKLLADVGIKIEIVRNTFPAYLEKEKNGNLQFFMGGWNADYPDAENFLFLLSSKNVAPGPNASNYVNPAYDKIYDQVAKMLPSRERDGLIKKAEEIVFNDGVWSMLYYPVRFNLYHGWLKNFRPNAQILNDVKYLDVDVEKKKELQKTL